jgi:hypothetical protein
VIAFIVGIVICCAQGIVGAPGRYLAVMGAPFEPESFIEPIGEAHEVLGGIGGARRCRAAGPRYLSLSPADSIKTSNFENFNILY